MLRRAALLVLALLALLPAAIAQPDPSEGTCPQAGYCAPCPDPHAVVQADGTILLTWSADARVGSWVVTRGPSDADTTQTVGTLPGNATSFVDANVTAGQTYYYRLHGLTGSVSGSCSEAVSATVPTTRVPVFPTTAALVLGVMGTAVVVGLAVTRRAK